MLQFWFKLNQINNFLVRCFFLDEDGVKQECFVSHEWKPSQCSNCLKLEHDTSAYRVPGKKKVWVKKHNSVVQVTEVQAITHKQSNASKMVDAEGFQRTLKPIKLNSAMVQPTTATNSFELLVDDAYNETKVTIQEIEEPRIQFGLVDDERGRGDSSQPNGQNIIMECPRDQ